MRPQILLRAHGLLVSGLIVFALITAAAAVANKASKDRRESRSLEAAGNDSTVSLFSKKFITHGGLLNFVDSVSAMAGVDRQYELQASIRQDTPRPDSIAIYWNNMLIATTADFDELGYATFVQPLQASVTNTLQVILGGPADANVKVSVNASPNRNYPIFGPQSYTHPTGGTQTYTHQFTRTGADHSYYHIYVLNPSDSGQTAMTSGTIKLDSVTILDSTEIAANLPTVVKRIYLSEGPHTLEVTLTGANNSGLKVWVTAYDWTPPVLSLTEPANNLITNGSQVTVGGTVQDQTATSVAINGALATVGSNGAFSGVVQLANEGANNITVIAQDAANLTAEVTRQVIRDTQAPALSVSTPSDGSYTNQPNIIVSGAATDANAVTVNANDIPLTLVTGGAFSGNIAASTGSNVVTVTATDAAGNTASVVRSVTLDSIPPSLVVASPTDSASASTNEVTVTGNVGDASPFTLTVAGITVTPDAGGAFSHPVSLIEGWNSIAVIATDAAGNSRSVTRHVELDGLAVPPDPATLATPIDPSIPTSMFAATEFLYVGENAIQSGVTPGTIKEATVTVLKGRVLDRAGNPLSGVEVTVAGRPEFGMTYSRADGRYDLVANGGGVLAVRLQRTGFLAAERSVLPRWRDYQHVDDVRLMPLDTASTVIDFSAPVEVARGSVVTDGDGTRRATLLFKQGTTASAVLPNDSIQQLSSITVRASEYTVGAAGPQAMPAELPPTVAYTYAVELTADEALAIGAREVTFSQPVVVYLENFLEYPVGDAVPSGYYDWTKNAWVPSDNGRIIKILGVSSGIAQVDVDGSNTAAGSTALDELGINDAELEQLASLYTVGQSLWRVPVTHFSPWDFNDAWGLVADAIWPEVVKIGKRINPFRPCNTGGSIIGCEAQTLGEVIGLIGTPFSLHYGSERTPGYVEGYTIDIPLTGVVHDSLAAIELRVSVAGKTVVDTFPPTPNLTTAFTWDGKDAYGRTLQGRQPVEVEIGYLYPGTRMTPAAQYRSFRRVTGNASLVRTRQYFKVSAKWNGYIGVFDTRALGVGGWTVSAHHAYDPSSRTVYFGSGGSRTPDGLGLTMARVAGTGVHASPGTDSLPATRVDIRRPHGIAAAPDGSFYFVENFSRIRKVTPNGVISTVAGDALTGFAGDGGPAVGARFSDPRGIALGPDGSLYIVDGYNHRVRRVDPNGTISTFAGSGASWPSTNGGYGGDGGPATASQLSFPTDVAVAPDGTVYIADYQNCRIREVTPDGIINTLAGNGTCRDSGTPAADGPARSAPLHGPLSLDVGPDGSVYFTGYYWVRKVTPGGMIETLSGAGGRFFVGDGGPAVSAGINYASGIAVGEDGSVYVVDQDHSRIRLIRPNGFITTIAGTGVDGNPPQVHPGSALQTALNNAFAVDVLPDGSLLVGDHGADMVRRIAPALPGLSSSDVVVPAESGQEVYVFNSRGRHLHTLHPLTGDTLLSFSYDSIGRLTELTDGNNNITTIERDGSGKVTGIVGPYGQRTSLAQNAAGFLQTIISPNQDTVRATYHTGGLLATLTDPRSNQYEFTYDTRGRLARDDDPAGGYKTLTPVSGADEESVLVETALGRETLYSWGRQLNGDFRRRVVGPDGLTNTWIMTARDTVRSFGPDSMVTTMLAGADPRFGMNAPTLRHMSIRSPGGLLMTITGSRRVTLADSANAFALTTMVDSFTVNGRVSTSVFDAATRRFTTTSPAGRQSFSKIDSQGRVLSDSITGIAALAYTYDARGRLETAAQGARTTTFAYDSLGRLASTTDPLNRVESYFYNSANQMTRLVMSNGREVQFGYDANGNVTSITPPTRPAHTFGYTAVDLSANYTAPALNQGEVPTQYTYNYDRQVTRILRPDSSAIDFGFDTAGRLSTLTIPGATYSYSYHPVSGLLNSAAARGDTIRLTYDGSLPTRFSWSGSVNGSVGFGYDNDFRLNKQFVNDADTVAFGYDNDGLLTSAGSMTLTRNPANGLLTGTTLGNVTTAQGYNAAGELASLSASYSGSNLLSQSFERDDLGRITKITETRGNTSKLLEFAYDSIGQLITVTTDSVVTASYTYDDNGNRTSVATSSGTSNATTDAHDRLLTHGASTFSYTKTGELKERVTGADTTGYTYDAAGNLVSVRVPDGRLIEYVIDPSNVRLAKRVNGTVTKRWVYGAPLQIAAELDSLNQVTSRFIYGERINTPEYLVKGGATYRVIADHLGSVRQVVNVLTGALAQELTYDTYGNVILDSNPGFQPFGFAGGLYDPDTRLVRFGARDYDAETGRWTSKDPAGFNGGGANMYAYALNNPLLYIDPFGLCPSDVSKKLKDFTRAFADGIGAMPGDCDTRPGWLAGARIGTLLGGLGRGVGLAARDATAPAKIAQGLGNIGGGGATIDQALNAALKWLGEGYKEIAPGVFRSADDARQFRMTADDLLDPKQGPHVHFESIGPDGRKILENSHVAIRGLQ